MLLAIDVGNTQTVLGVFDTDSDNQARSGDSLGGLLHHWRVETVAKRAPDEYVLLLSSLLELVGLALPLRSTARELADGRRAIDGIALSSSVPAVTQAMRQMTREWLETEVVIVEPGIKTGMPILYTNPREVGADRIVNAVAALDLYGAPAIVVDLGTATTFDVISPKGEYLGGAIAPGLEISMDALFAHAAALRRVELVEPASAIGRSTVESMQSGAIYGYAGLVDGMCDRIKVELGEAVVIATGGLCSLIAPYTRSVRHIEPWLTLHGLRLLYERNLASNDGEARG
jgi:type III pantothenate kinase